MAQKGEETEDLRVRRTRKLLQQAFIELTVEKGFVGLSVQDIADRAMVNRSTFYRYYLDKYDLLDQYMNEISALISSDQKQTFVPEKTGGPPTQIPVGLVSFLKHIQQNGSFYRVMLGPKGDPVFTQRLRQNIENRFRFLIANYAEDTDPNAPPVEMRISYISYADIGAIIWWLDNIEQCSVEQFASWISGLTSASAGLSMMPNLESKQDQR